MYRYELFLSNDVEGKKIHFVQTNHKVDNLDKWLRKLVKENTISKDIADAVTFVW
ncbi:hypothetical protein [Butyrivibrio sp. VCD2006]|uniref:hypothetical protein n=1 Tax=Butyrivibrio sp. VCD2006 TaxID=1280664 RepID=UPI000409DE8D|nr:hypothetical protein [Butyrivibrio sp. VCD2006]